MKEAAYNSPHNHLSGSRSMDCTKWKFPPGFLKKSKTYLLAFVFISLGINLCFLMETSLDFTKRTSYRQDRQGIQPDVKVANGVSYNRRRIQYDEDASKQLHVKVTASHDHILLTTEGIQLARDYRLGLHVFALNEATGSFMSHRVFPVKDSGGLHLKNFLESIHTGRLLIFGLLSNGTDQHKLDARIRQVIGQEGSRFSGTFQSGDTWVLAVFKGVGKVDELLSKPTADGSGEAITMIFSVRLTLDAPLCPNWPDTSDTQRRRRFCRLVEGYRNVCSCTDPVPITFYPNSTVLGRSAPVIPVCLVSRNEPYYLFRSLQSIISAPDATLKSILVFIDGHYDEARLICELFGVPWIHQRTKMNTEPGRSSQQFRTSIARSFQHFPRATELIILEDDVDVSPDLFSYFHQISPVLSKDPSLLCASAWNDQAFVHSSGHSGLVYRVESLPQRALMITRKLWTSDLTIRWPDPEKSVDWWKWLRWYMQTSHRECLIPDVNRVHHFGEQRTARSSLLYTPQRMFNSKAQVRLHHVENLMSNSYDELLNEHIQNAKVTQFDFKKCIHRKPNLPKLNDTHLIYIPMSHPNDFLKWRRIEQCMKLIPVETSCLHKLSCRLFINGTQTIFIGWPYSPFRRKSTRVTKSNLQKDSTENLVK